MSTDVHQHSSEYRRCHICKELYVGQCGHCDQPCEKKWRRCKACRQGLKGFRKWFS